jgi:protease-4
MLLAWISYRDYFDSSFSLREQFYSHNASAEDKVAVIRATGVLAESEGYIKSQLAKVKSDESVKAIVLRVTSPGGTVSASDYLYHHLTRLREDREIPIVVSMGGIAASGGYYISMAVGDQEDSIYAEPTTTTGSIGVIIPHYDISGLLEKYDVKNDSIVSHPRKQMLSMTRAVSEEDRALLQRYVDQSFDRFKEVVKSGRPKFREDPSSLDALATGEIFTANQALASGLVDRIGFIEEAIERAIELAGLDKASTRVVTYYEPLRPLGAIGFASASQTSVRPELPILKLSVPEAYYLFTTLPGITH